MSLFNWGEKYTLGISSIDNQHKKLFEIANSIYDLWVNDKSNRKDVGIILDELVNYTQNHFLFEENLLNEHNYPASEYHFSEHDKLVDELRNHCINFQKGNTMDIMDILNFTIEWLQNHILETDKKYSIFLTSRGVE